MTSRSRVQAALEHRQPDRVPVDVSGHRSSGISAVAYSRLRRHLDLDLRVIRVYDLVQQLAIVDEDVLATFGVDTIELGRGFALVDEDWEYWVLPDGTPCLIPKWVKPRRDGKRWVLSASNGREIAELPAGNPSFVQTYFPFAEGSELEDIASALAECLGTGDLTTLGPAMGPLALSRGAIRLRANSDRAVLGLFGGSLFKSGLALYGPGVFSQLLASESQRAHSFLDRLVQSHAAQLERFLVAVGPFIDLVVFEEDFDCGPSPGTPVSRAMYREFFQQRHQQLWQRAKELADVKVLLRCRGDICELLPDLIDSGLDAVQGLSCSTSNDLAQIKAEFGAQVTFWGVGHSLLNVLTHGTPPEVAAEVQRQVEILAPGGGFVFQPPGNVPCHTTPENIVAMFDALRDVQR